MSGNYQKRPSSNWKVLAERVVYEHIPWLRLIEQDICLPNGVLVEKYLLTETPDVSMIFAVTDEGEAIFVEQYKHGMAQLSLDLCAGYVDPTDRSPQAAAQRELLEETGFESEQWSFLTSLFMSPNRSRARIHYFLAQGCQKTSRQRLDPTEDLRVILLSLDEIPGMIAAGGICTVSSVAGVSLGLSGINHALSRGKNGKQG